jgi:hypothetical protein
MEYFGDELIEIYKMYKWYEKSSKINRNRFN